MLVIGYNKQGWSKPEIRPFELLNLSPAMQCFHYATSVRLCGAPQNLVRPVTNGLKIYLTSASKVSKQCVGKMDCADFSDLTDTCKGFEHQQLVFASP